MRSSLLRANSRASSSFVSPSTTQIPRETPILLRSVSADCSFFALLSLLSSGEASAVKLLNSNKGTMIEMAIKKATAIIP